MLAVVFIFAIVVPGGGRVGEGVVG